MRLFNLNRSSCILFVILLAIGFYKTAFAGNIEVLTLGRATDQIAKEYKRLHPIVTYLAERLKKDGVTQGQAILEGSNNNQNVIDLFNHGDLDLVLESPFSAARYLKECDAVPILLVSREGLIEYNSYIFVHTDSPIQKLPDLLGKTVAFEDSTSTSAYHLPKRSLLKMGFDCIPVQTGSHVSDTSIGYVFAGSEINISTWVYTKKVAAGCLSVADWVDPEENPVGFRKKFRIIHETEFIPRMYVMANKKLSSKIMARIKQEMLAMHKSPEGREALSHYRIDYFCELSPKAETLIKELASN